MSQDQAVSYEDTLDEPPLLDSTPQLESFPPLFITNADVYNSPSLKLSPSNHTVETYDNPAALNTQLQKYLGMPYNEYQYLLSTLYSIYSLPNTVLPFLFGSLVDKFGPQRVLLFLNGCVCIGQTLFSIGVQNRQVWLMLVGRAIFGIGGESCSVAQASITTMYFRGHELAFALGLNLCIARFGSVVNAIVTPWAEQLWGVPTAVWIGTLSCLASFISAVCLAMLIGDNEQVEMSKEKEDSYTTPLLSVTSGMNANESDSSLDLAINPTDHEDLDTLSASPQSSAQSPIIQHLPGIIQRQPSFAGSINSVRFSPGIPKSGTPPSLHIITDQSQNQDSWYHQWWDDIKYFPSTFWLICTLTILLYGTVVPFNNIASDFLQSKWYHNNPRKAAAVMGIPDTIGAILVPGFGYIVDKYGRRASTLIASAAIMCCYE
ncbi:hypothetical protein BGZ76_001910 [Entomortierella beljakovae]|nr:hypothetical protein BGZ76_001910 [Entomortierella beljakovae]